MLADRVLEVIRARPGITIPDIARELDIDARALYMRDGLPALHGQVVSGQYGNVKQGWWAHPVPWCSCPPSYVRDVCRGHPEPGCELHGLFGHDLRDATRTAMERAVLAG